MLCHAYPCPMFTSEQTLRVMVKCFQEPLRCQMTGIFFVEILASPHDVRITFQRKSNREIWLVGFEIFPCLLLLLNAQILMLAFQTFDDRERLPFDSQMNLAPNEIWIVNFTVGGKLYLFILRRLNAVFRVHDDIFWSIHAANFCRFLLRFFLSRYLRSLRFFYPNFPFLI